MTLASKLRFQDYQFSHQTPRGLWRWTTRVDLTLSVPSYEIRDIASPYGLLRDSIPIPGVVTQMMALSIDELSQAFAPTILLGPTSLSFTVDEGRGWSEPQSVQVTNSGPYGSLLGVGLTTGDPYLKTSPSIVGNLASNEAGSFDVTVDATNLLALSSPYHTTIAVQDSQATNTPQVIPVTVTVNPKAAIEVSPASLEFYVTRNVDGTFPAIPVQIFAVGNVGPDGSVLQYEVQKLIGLSPWLTGFVPYSGTVTAPGAQNVQVTVRPADGTSPGTYRETLRISGYSTNCHVDLDVTLTIT